MFDLKACVVVAASAFTLGCRGDFAGDGNRLDNDFAIPRSEVFPQNLAAYQLFDGAMADLAPADGVVLYELAAELFTDYAKKQRLIRLPADTSATIDADGNLVFPEGAVIAKTFYYPDDFTDETAGRTVIETRLLVLRDGQWNVATYLWNDAQDAAVLSLEGSTANVRWIDHRAEPRSTIYEVPSEVACVTCHQRDNQVVAIGPAVDNLNRRVLRDGSTVNQLEYLVAQGALSAFDTGSTPAVPDYNDTDESLANRGRAYLHANCAHCHNPGAWSESANEDLDFRYGTDAAESGVLANADEIDRLLSEGEMPLVGTTILHDEGVALIQEYVQSLP